MLVQAFNYQSENLSVQNVFPIFWRHFGQHWKWFWDAQIFIHFQSQIKQLLNIPGKKMMIQDIKAIQRAVLSFWNFENWCSNGWDISVQRDPSKDYENLHPALRQKTLWLQNISKEQIWHHSSYFLSETVLRPDLFSSFAILGELNTKKDWFWNLYFCS